ncbi:hypothetical protein NRB20_45260 [Nocardia sp. RB20]|uniref:Uncharacterized protein n=2 Tax=Nocardia macrotermitis TaxID=2585198 RepID=A0A7K0D6N7_9NOCA|nr:hypothetical protein [Nocardia macrotermitis]
MDLNDIGEHFLSNASRISAAVSLPGNTSGLLATLTPSFLNFQDRVSSLGRDNHGRIVTFGTKLGDARHTFQREDDSSATEISAVSPFTTAEYRTPADSIRFGDMHLPELPDIQTSSRTTKKAVVGAHDIVSIFDDGLNQSIGIKPAARYLAPLADDWEHVQTIGKRIRQLGINDSFTSDNLSGGSQWLTSKWSGTAADSYTTAMHTLHSGISQRGTDMEIIGKTLEKGGECLERLVHNQAAAVTTGLMQPLNILGITLPVGVWALIADRPMRGSYKSQITTAVDTVRNDAEARSNSITNIMDRIHTALAYEPGTPIAEPTGALFVPQEKVAVDYGTIRYGFGNNVWWEQSLASAA